MNKCEEYAILKAQAKELETKIKDLQEDILDEMVQSGEIAKETSMGKFSIATLKTWVYPDKVVEIGENFKAAKAEAESTGDATYTTTPSLRFAPVKL
jgi:HD-like signal output (HDOD) protein